MIKKYKLLTLLLLAALTMAVLFPDIVGKIHRKIGGVRYLNEFEFYKSSLWEYYKNRAKTLKDSSVIFFGDSRINSLSVESHFNAVNFAISGETLKRASREIPEFENLAGKTLFLSYGINDNNRDPRDIFNDYLSLLGALESSTVFILEVLPVDENDQGFDNEKVGYLNTLLRKLPNFIPIHGLDDDGKLIHTYDGVHLDSVGNGIFLSELQSVITTFE